MRPMPSAERPTLWCGPPLVLASKSRGRAEILRAAGIPFVPINPNIDERAIETGFSGKPEDLAAKLALAKALDVSITHPNRMVIAADQILACGDDLLHKAVSLEDARAKLWMLRGRPHFLHSAASLTFNGVEQFAHVATAIVHFADFDAPLLDAYLEAMGEKALQTVGAYEIEGFGANLIETIEGDFFTIVGFPLLPFLAHCRATGLIAGRRPA